MERVRISKTKFFNCVNMYYNEYQTSVQVTFEGSLYYRRFTLYVIANDEKEAKKFANGYLDAVRDIAPVVFEDEEGWKRFVDALCDEQMRDELQAKFIHYSE